MRKQLLRFLCVSLHNMRRPILPQRKIWRQNGRESFATQKTFIVVPCTEELHGRAQKFYCWVHQSPIVSGEKKWVLKFFFLGGVVLSPLPFNSSGFFGGLRGQFRRWEASFRIPFVRNYCSSSTTGKRLSPRGQEVPLSNGRQKAISQHFSQFHLSFPPFFSFFQG